MNEKYSGLSGSRTTFLQFFKRYTAIEIPILQRDYVQGRSRAEESRVRGNFIKDITNALIKEEILNLDFIYGEMKGNCFQLIDGQQRLTTLFLLHWYLSAQDDQYAEFQEQMKINGKSRFRYSIRPSADRFFAKLLEHESKNKSENEFVDNYIRDQTWFFADWSNDPTIASALSMLRAIEKAIREKLNSAPQSDSLYKRLSNKEILVFDVLDLGSVGQGDDIYIKMNARGKPLTGFEKFKAWLLKRCEAKGISSASYYNLDRQWVNFFWKQQLKNKKESEILSNQRVSKVIFDIFIALAINFHAGKKEKDAKQIEDWLSAAKNVDDNIILWDALFDADCIASVFASIGRFVDLWDELQLNALFNEASQKLPVWTKDRPDELFSKGPVNLKMTLWLHAIGLFLQYKTADKQISEDWLRIMRNLIENCEPNKETFHFFIKGVNSLVDIIGKPAGENISQGIETPSGFNKNQFREEQYKMNLLSNPDWKSLVYEAENHDLLRGRIDFLLVRDSSYEYADEFNIFDLLQARWNLFKEHGRGFLESDPSKLLETSTKHIINALKALQSSDDHPTSVSWLTIPGKTDEWRELFKHWPKDKAAITWLRSGCQKLLNGQNAQGGDEKSLPPWAKDILHGDGALIQYSESRKIHNYNGGVFFYHKKNTNELDILLGDIAHLRNALIEEMTSSGRLRFKRDDERRKRRIEAAGTVFYRGHDITLDSSSGELQFSCKFGLEEITLQVGLDKNAADSSIEYSKYYDSSELSYALNAEIDRLLKH